MAVILGDCRLDLATAKVRHTQDNLILYLGELLTAFPAVDDGRDDTHGRAVFVGQRLAYVRLPRSLVEEILPVLNVAHASMPSVQAQSTIPPNGPLYRIGI